MPHIFSFSLSPLFLSLFYFVHSQPTSNLFLFLPASEARIWSRITRDPANLVAKLLSTIQMRWRDRLQECLRQSNHWGLVCFYFQVRVEKDHHTYTAKARLTNTNGRTTDRHGDNRNPRKHIRHGGLQKLNDSTIHCLVFVNWSSVMLAFNHILPCVYFFGQSCSHANSRCFHSR